MFRKDFFPPPLSVFFSFLTRSHYVTAGFELGNHLASVSQVLE